MVSPKTSERRPRWCRNMPGVTKPPRRPSLWRGCSNTRRRSSPCWEPRAPIDCGPVPRRFPFLWAERNGTLFLPRLGEHPCLEIDFDSIGYRGCITGCLKGERRQWLGDHSRLLSIGWHAIVVPGAGMAQDIPAGRNGHGLQGCEVRAALHPPCSRNHHTDAIGSVIMRGAIPARVPLHHHKVRTGLVQVAIEHRHLKNYWFLLTTSLWLRRIVLSSIGKERKYG